MTNSMKAALVGAATLFGFGVLAYTLELGIISIVCFLGAVTIMVMARP